MGCLVRRKFYGIEEEIDVGSNLMLPNPGEPFVVYCDASKMGLGGVLM